MKIYDTLYIDGQWVTPASRETIDVIDSSTEEIFARVPLASAADADRAVRAARAAFAGWSTTEPQARAAIIQTIAEGLKARSDDLAQAIAREVGMPLKMASRVQVGGPVWAWGNYARLAREFHYEEKVGHSLVVREPVGVVAAITPWNYPLNQITLKVAAALAAGCTVVLKPSEVAPVNAFILAEVIAQSGLPKGVFNLVTGTGPEVGEALAGHELVDMVSFTGSTRAGKRVTQLASGTVKRVALELGGKSAAVILPDADLAQAVKATVGNCMMNSGQTCSAHTRMIVLRSRLEEALALAKAAAEAFTVGPALAEGSKLGPLISAVQRERVLGLIRKGVDEGARLVTGGTEPPEGLVKGFFVRPTVLCVNDSRATVAQEEIFGPVLTVIPYDTEEEAIAIANDSIYGLAGAVWAGGDERALQAARRIRTGQIDINGGAWNPQAPFGGYKQSGVGRENGVYGLEEFLQFKALQFKPAA
jgi:aldehyde dehydrogenase (NAD+)